MNMTNYPTPHPFKRKLSQKNITLWQLKHLLSGSPSEARLSRILNGIEAMPNQLEKNIRMILSN